MRFEISVALKYLIPKWRQLSVSIISLISILVISLVVWLVIVFLSVTEGIEKKWVEELVALNAPLRITPKEAYYHSYYYRIDELSSSSNYSNKTIGEKLQATCSDPYDPAFDAELPQDFPSPHFNEDGTLKDLVKEGWSTLESMKGFAGLKPREYEVSFGNLRLNLIRNTSPKLLPEVAKETVLNQVSYVSSFDGENMQLASMLVPLREEDYANLFTNLGARREEIPSSFQKRLAPFMENIEISSLITAKEGWLLPKSLYPKEGTWRGCALVHQGKVRKIFIPHERGGFDPILHTLSEAGFEPLLGDLYFNEEKLSFCCINREQIYSMDLSPNPAIIIEADTPFAATLVPESLELASRLSHLQFQISGNIQGTPLEGTVFFNGFRLGKLTQQSTELAPYWVHQGENNIFAVPSQNPLGEGILIPKSYQESGARIGDPGTISYTGESTSSMQEMRLPIYIAGFYDPGLMPVGNRVVLADASVTALLRTDYTFADKMLGNGVAVYLDKFNDAPKAKWALQKALEEQELDKYWKVESFADYELTQPILQQLKSDKTLFTLIAVIILIVACSNIISMLILLVNDKRKEIGIMQSMGASKLRIGLIFGICGLTTGLLSSIIGTIAAIWTLKQLQTLVGFLNFLQGHEAFHEAFYGSHLPNTLSMSSLGFVVVATICISILAGIVPAVKAARIQPSQILRSE